MICMRVNASQGTLYSRLHARKFVHVHAFHYRMQVDVNAAFTNSRMHMQEKSGISKKVIVHSNHASTRMNKY